METEVQTERDVGTTYLLHNIGQGPTSNYTPRDKVISAEGVLTFDGVYRSVYVNRDLLTGRPGILFVIGMGVGWDNRFDGGQPLERFCTWEEIFELRDVRDLEIGWHTWTHPDLTTVDDGTLARELRPPFPMKHFAYPYGKFDDRVIEAVKAAGFESAWTAGRGDDSQYQRRRWHL